MFFVGVRLHAKLSHINIPPTWRMCTEAVHYAECVRERVRHLKKIMQSRTKNLYILLREYKRSSFLRNKWSSYILAEMWANRKKPCRCQNTFYCCCCFRKSDSWFMKQLSKLGKHLMVGLESFHIYFKMISTMVWPSLRSNKTSCKLWPWVLAEHDTCRLC